MRILADMTTLAGFVQSIPAGAISLVDVFSNMGVGGGSPGRAIKRITKEELETTNPNWQSQTASAEADFWVYDPDIPNQFFLSPPALLQDIKIATVNEIPAYDTTDAGTQALIDLTVSTNYLPALINYTAGMLLTRNSDRTQSYQKGMMLLKQFDRQMGTSIAADMKLEKDHE